jgi:hypothetical protein
MFKFFKLTARITLEFGVVFGDKTFTPTFIAADPDNRDEYKYADGHADIQTDPSYQ